MIYRFEPKKERWPSFYDGKATYFVLNEGISDEKNHYEGPQRIWHGDAVHVHKKTRPQGNNFMLITSKHPSFAQGVVGGA